MQELMCGSRLFGVVPRGGWVEGHPVRGIAAPIMAFTGLNPASFIYTGLAV